MFLIRFSVTLLLALGTTWLHAGQDPTRPPFFGAAANPVAQESLHLSLIVDDARLRRAIINETVGGESDTVAGARVLRIESDRVRLVRAGQYITLQLPLAQIRKDHSDE